MRGASTAERSGGGSRPGDVARPKRGRHRGDPTTGGNTALSAAHSATAAPSADAVFFFNGLRASTLSVGKNYEKIGTPFFQSLFSSRFTPLL